MRKSGRPSNAPKRLKDGFYMLIHDSINRKPIRIMRESREEMELVKIKYKNRNYQYLGEVKDNFWVDGNDKGKSTT